MDIELLKSVEVEDLSPQVDQLSQEVAANLKIILEFLTWRQATRMGTDCFARKEQKKENLANKCLEKADLTKVTYEMIGTTMQKNVIGLTTFFQNYVVD